MDYIKAFLIGGMICALAQVLLDRTRLMPGRVMVLLVVSGCILGFAGVYEPFARWAGAGASVPLLGFGNTLWKGVKEGIEKEGLLGIFKGGLTASSAGICGAHFEDQVTPKRCGGMKGVQIETAQVFIRKIETALTFRRDPNFLVIARSDAAEVEGEDEAIRRLNLAAEAGADMGFLFSSKGVFETLDSVKRACDQIKVPILYCLMEFCPEVCFTLEELRQAGVRAVIWPNGLLMRWCKAASDLIQQFKETGDCKTFFDQLMPIDQCNQLLGIRDWNPSGMF